MQTRRLAFVATVLLSLVFLLALAAPALGIPDVYAPQWGTGANGGYYRGTHGWVMYNGALTASHHGVTWINYNVAVDRSSWPDTVFHDNIDHNYDRWGNYPSWYDSSWHQPFGNPQVKVQRYYNDAVAALRRGDTTAASADIGLMSHYFADIHQPMHTEESAGETRAVHTNYEAEVDHMLPSPSSHQGWIHDNGFQYIPNASAFTVSEAVNSHTHYSSLVNNYRNDGFNSTVEDITSTQLNRAVNGLSDLIVSAQWDADNVNAIIDSASPSSATTGQPVTFSGHGYNPRYGIVAYQWRSSVNGVLSTAPSFTTTTLSPGIHMIYFKVEDKFGKWSPEVWTPYVVGNDGTIPLPMYRFYNVRTGTHFYTASEAEKHSVVARLSATYRLEGVAFALDASSTVNDTPLYRFYNFRQGVHFYSASDAEKNHVMATLGNVYRFDGPVCKVATTSVDTQPVFRFYNFKKGVHFYTASAAERDSVISHLSKTYRYEGVAYYFKPPW